MREYTSKQISKLVTIKNDIVQGHEKCEGEGHLEKDGTIKACSCMKIFNYIKDLYYYGIPSDYWQLTLDKLKVDDTYKKIIKTYINNIDNAIENGQGLILFSDQRGIGKTALLCEIAKTATAKRYEVYYQLAQKLIDSRYKDDGILDRALKAEILIIDEFDKVMMKAESNIIKQMENFLREILPYKKAVCIGANFESEEEIENKFKIISLIRRYIKLIPMEGEDFSENKQDSWMEKLKGKEINYFHKNIITMAKIHSENQERADEKEYNELF